MHSSYKFSLLVPCYNAENYIDNFIKNINGLDKSFDEILFYDDASTDNSYQLLTSRGYKVIRGTENKGAGHARNKLIEYCSCEWVHFHDIDDGLKPNYLTKVASIIERNKNVDVVLCNVDWYDARSKELLLNWKYSNSEINLNSLKYTIANPIGGINGLYRKSKVIEINGFNTHIRIWEDSDFHVRLASSKAAFYIIEEVLSYSLRYQNSASADQSNAWLIRLRLLQEYSNTYFDPKILLEIGIQSQVAASALILQNQINAAKKAFQLSEKCGLPIPFSTSKIWTLLKLLFPASVRIKLRLFQLQYAFNKK
ncbi:MAG: glycosyltransferase [Pedobacter sp.]|nr:MAG: glycosyltransferase [Pedobacter sp.]